MTQPINLALYRLLVKGGATETDAEEAARIDASTLATKADLAELKAVIADLKADLTWRIVLAMGAQTALIGVLIRLLQP